MKKSKAQIDRLIREQVKKRIAALEGKRGKKAKKRATRKLIKGTTKHFKKLGKKEYLIKTPADAEMAARALDDFCKRFNC
jgi:hypothetical protein